MNRKKQLKQLAETDQFDLAIIGGGASGLGTALDAASRGLKTVLFEGVDFSKGTSSRSTKLVHGGVRYLAQGDVSLVYDALKERGIMGMNAGHLVSSQSFIIPIYSTFDGLFYSTGLKVYNWMARHLSLGKSEVISKEKTIKRLPTIRKKGLKSGVVYFDGKFDDSRYAINMAQTAIEQGAIVINHCKVTNLNFSKKGKVNGLVVVDQLNQKKYKVKAKVIINATGVFTNGILKLDSSIKNKNLIVPSQGVHLMFDRSFLPSKHALMIPKTSDGRVLFAVPWHGKLLVGTTDTLVKKPSYEPIAFEKEIQFILDTMAYYMTKKPSRKDVLSVFAGLRPLAAPEEEGKSTKEVSRSHKIIISNSGLITLTGGKWTTYRQIAEELVDKAIEKGNLASSKCISDIIPLHGHTQNTNHEDLMAIYGTDQALIAKLAQKENMSKLLHKNYPYTYAHVIWAIREEMAQTVEDILARRIRLLFLDARAAMKVAPKVAKCLAAELGKDDKWVKQQLKSFKKVSQNYILA